MWTFPPGYPGGPVGQGYNPAQVCFLPLRFDFTVVRSAHIPCLTTDVVLFWRLSSSRRATRRCLICLCRATRRWARCLMLCTLLHLPFVLTACAPLALLSPHDVAKWGLQPADLVLASPLAPFLIVCQGGYPTPGQVT